MNEKKVSQEQARADLDRWLDAKRVPQKRRDEVSAMYENIVEAITEGHVTIDEENKLTQIIQFPEQCATESLTYKIRITDKDKEPYKRVVKGDSFSDELKRTILAATGCLYGNLRQFDTTTDLSLSESIAVFFV